MSSKTYPARPARFNVSIIHDWSLPQELQKVSYFRKRGYSKTITAPHGGCNGVTVGRALQLEFKCYSLGDRGNGLKRGVLPRDKYPLL